MCFIVFCVCVLRREKGEEEKKTDFIPNGPYTIKYVAPGEKKEREKKKKKSGNGDGRHTNLNSNVRSMLLLEATKNQLE